MEIPRLPKNNILCVPIKVQAMMVGTTPSPTVFADITDNFSKIGRDPLGNQVPAPIMSEKNQEKPGIHLSWILPEGLRQGYQTHEELEPEYPRVPNRWIVSRLWSSKKQPDRVSCKHWIVESDAMEKEKGPVFWNEDSLTFPKLDDPDFPYRILGRSFPIDTNVNEPMERFQDLHALGPGNPAFSVMYPYHVNIFGFYDDLLAGDKFGNRLKDIRVSYVIRGYYQNQPALIESEEICRYRFGWKPPEGLAYPAFPVLHGVVTGLHWVDDEKDYNGHFISNLPMPKLAVGNSSVEAVAALNATNHLSNERLMRVLLNDQSHKLMNLDGIYQADYTDHKKRFQIVAEQNSYSLQSKISSSDSDHQELPELTPDEERLFRSLQQGLDELYKQRFDADAKRSLIYDLWCKYIITGYTVEPLGNDQARINMREYEEALAKEIQALDLTESGLEQLAEHLKILEQQLVGSIHSFYDLEQTADHRFYEPNSPVLLLSGASRGNLFDSNRSPGELLKCRLLGEAIRSFTIDFKFRENAYSVSCHTDQLLAQKQIKGNYPELLLEAVLFTSNCADLLVHVIAQQLDLLPLSENEYDDLLKVFNQALEDITKRGILDKGQQLPDPLFLNVWSEPWNPVILSWRALYYPDKNLVGSHPQLDHWNFQGTDYVYHNSEPDTHESVVIEGSIFLTPHIAEQLYAMTLKQLGEEDARKFGSLTQLDYLSQTLESFNERFLMSQLALRFPVMVFNIGSAELAARVREALGEFAIEKPLFNTFFSPLRGGWFKLDKLRLIDTFGQFQEVQCSQYAIAEDMRMLPFPIGQYVMLPPRFMQPTRLEFNWIQGRTGENCDFNLPDSPICGWMIPNYMDQSLLIYDEDGFMLGSLIVTAYDGDRVHWRNAPGTPEREPSGGGSAELPVGINPDLKAFLSEFLRRSREHKEDVLTPFLDLVDSAVWEIHQPESTGSTGLSQYAGKPLALVKAHVKLVQAGPPAAYKFFETFKGPDSPPDISISQFKMPLWIGETHHTGDGMVGFFVQDDYDQTGYKQFNSAFADTGYTSDYFRHNRQVDVSANHQANGTALSLIMDPYATIHLISGMLPVSEHRLPPDRIEAALNRLYLTFYLGPLLAGGESYVLPLTQLPNREWELITPGDDGAWVETSNLHPSNGNAFLVPPPLRAVEGWLKLKLGESPDSESH